ncbi:MAG: TonB-dependent receptor [Gammaproteobacteria bacterium]|nr:TonB-dependent receptor [Gammaproteobacteria bacterium]
MKNAHRKKRSSAMRATCALTGAVAALGGLAGVAQAQNAKAGASADQGLAEIVVTAQRRTTNLQTTPIAVTAVDANVIAQLEPRTLQDLAMMVPNFSANKINGFNAASFAMRGVGNTDIIVYNEAPVAVLIDDFVMPSTQTQLLDPFDVQEVEVLRGPQGTLFGKNTTGGAVVVKTKPPVLDETSFDTQMGFGSFNSYNAHGALNIPLISHQLAMRVVASEDREDGWMRNGASDTIGGVTYHGNGQSVGGTNVFTGRAKLLWEPSDSFRALFTYEMLTDRSQTPGAVNTTPTNSLPGSSTPYFVFALLGLPGYTGNNPLGNAGVDGRSGYLVDEQNGHRVDASGEHLNIDWKTDYGTLTWVQGYRSQDSSLPSDYTGVVGPLSVFDANRSDRRKTWQEEARFTSKQIGNWNYVAGAFYQHDNTKFCVSQILGIYDLFGVPTPPGAQPGGYNNNPQVLCNAQTEKSEALYGETNYKFTDATTLTVGARITKDSKDWIGRQQVFVQQLPSPTGAFVPSFTYNQLGGLMNAGNFAAYPFGVVTDSHSWTQPTYRVTLSHKFDPDLFGYVNFSHGFKAGGYNDQVGTGGTPISAAEKAPTNPEKADSFETGIKSEWFDHRLRLNEALFYVKYTDLIRQVVVPITNLNGQAGEETLFKNAATMKAYGIENELTAELADGLLLHVPFSFQHCEYGSFVTLDSTGHTVDLSGLPVNRCPAVTATVDLNYTMAVPGTDGHHLVFDLNDNYVSKNLDTYSIAAPYQPFTQTYADARALLGASITYQGPDDRWYVRLYGRNLTNKLYVESAQNVDPLWIWSFYGEPRFIGGEVGYKFGR